MSKTRGNEVVRLYDKISTNITDFFKPYIPGFTTERALAAVVLFMATKQVVEEITSHVRHKQLKKIGEQKKNQRNNQILKEFTPTIDISEELNTLILNSTVTGLIKLLNDGEVTSEQILRVYHNRAVSIGLRLDLLADSNFPEALELAKRCDEVRKSTPKEERHRLGLLFGIPISIKDSIAQKGLDATIGLVDNCYRPCIDDSPVIKQMKAQGMIPFIRSNVGVALSIFETNNNVWGRAVNPWDVTRTPGGSSGGDAGLVAARCTPIGFGSDHYGSIRLPAAFCGVYGFKATAGRFNAGEQIISPQDHLKLTFLQANTGPIGRCVEDLATLTRELITPQNRVYNPSLPLVRWDEEKYRSKAKYKIGYVVSEDFFGASQVCQRAVKEAVAVLEKAGHQVEQIRIPNFYAISLAVIRILYLDGKASRLLTALNGEKPVKELAPQVMLGCLSNWSKTLIRPFLGKRTRTLVDQTYQISPDMVALHVANYYKLRDEFLKFWIDSNLDAIVLPVAALPSFRPGHSSRTFPATCYLWLSTFANTPSGVVPVTKVQVGEDVYTTANTIFNSDAMFKCSQDCIQGTVGLPVGVQVMTLPWEDEKCLNIMKAIENEIRFHELPTVN